MERSADCSVLTRVTADIVFVAMVPMREDITACLKAKTEISLAIKVVLIRRTFERIKQYQRMFRKSNGTCLFRFWTSG